MGIIQEIIDRSSNHCQHLFCIDIFINETKEGCMFVDVDAHKKRIKFCCVHPYIYNDGYSAIAARLAIAYDFYNRHLTKPIPEGWTFTIEDLYGYGVPFHQLHLCAMRFLQEWNTMDALSFRRRLKQELKEWNVELEVPDIEQYAYMIDGMCFNLYGDRCIEYILRKDKV